MNLPQTAPPAARPAAPADAGRNRYADLMRVGAISMVVVVGHWLLTDITYRGGRHPQRWCPGPTDPGSAGSGGSHARAGCRGGWPALGVEGQLMMTDLDTREPGPLSRVDQDSSKEADQLIGCVQRQHV